MAKLSERSVTKRNRNKRTPVISTGISTSVSGGSASGGSTGVSLLTLANVWQEVQTFTKSAVFSAGFNSVGAVTMESTLGVDGNVTVPTLYADHIQLNDGGDTINWYQASAHIDSRDSGAGIGITGDLYVDGALEVNGLITANSDVEVDSLSSIYFSSSSPLNAITRRDGGQGIGVGNDFYVDGDLNVQGTIYSYSQDEINVGDSWFNMGVADVTGQDGGLRMYSGSGTVILSKLWYDASEDYWVADGSGNSSQWEAGYDHSLVVTGQVHGMWTKTGNDLSYSGGNVGIGTTSPDYPLTFENSLGGKINLYPGQNWGIGLQNNLMEFIVSNVNGDWTFGSGTSGSLTKVMTIEGTGNVGIGTASPSSKLNVEDGQIRLSDSSQNNLVILSDNGTSDEGQIRLYDSTAVTTSITANGNSYFNGGNVGIGTTSPERNFEIEGSSNVVAIQLSNTGAGGLIWSLFSTNDGSGLGGGKFVIFDDTTGADRLVIDNAGNVGIGTTSPNYKLDVTGSGRFTTNIYTDFIYQNTTAGMIVRADNGLYLMNDLDALSIVGNDLFVYNNIGSDVFASQTTGWRIDEFGQADFRYIYTDELRTQAFTADVSQALAGSDFLTKSVSKLSVNFVIPATSATGQLIVDDLESLPGIACFQNGDYIRLRVFNRSGGGLVIAGVWGTVVLDVTYGTGGFASDNTQAYTFTSLDDGGVSGESLFAGSIVLDYGTSGDGFIENTVLDAAGAPYSQIVTWVTDPSNSANYTVQNRTGDLGGITSSVFGALSGYGFYATGNAYLEGAISSTEGFIGGWTLAATTLTSGDVTIDSANELIKLGSGATGTSNTGIYFKSDGTFNIASSATDYIRNSGTDLIVKSTNFALTASGSIALGATTYTLGDGVYISSGIGSKFRVGNASASRMQWDDTNLLFYNSSNENVGSIGATTQFAGFAFNTTNFTKTLSSTTLTMGNTTSFGSGYSGFEAYLDADNYITLMAHSTQSHVYLIGKSAGDEIFRLSDTGSHIAGWGFDVSKIYNANIQLDDTNSNIDFNAGGNLRFFASGFTGTVLGNIYTTGGNLVLEPAAIQSDASSGWIYLKGLSSFENGVHYETSTSVITLINGSNTSTNSMSSYQKIDSAAAVDVNVFLFRTSTLAGESYLLFNDGDYDIDFSTGGTGGGRFANAITLASSETCRITFNFELAWVIELIG